jgi:hypothetical protein
MIHKEKRKRNIRQLEVCCSPPVCLPHIVCVYLFDLLFILKMYFECKMVIKGREDKGGYIVPSYCLCRPRGSHAQYSGNYDRRIYVHCEVLFYAAKYIDLAYGLVACLLQDNNEILLRKFTRN